MSNSPCIFMIEVYSAGSDQSFKCVIDRCYENYPLDENHEISKHQKI